MCQADIKLPSITLLTILRPFWFLVTSFKPLSGDAHHGSPDQHVRSTGFLLAHSFLFSSVIINRLCPQLDSQLPEELAPCGYLLGELNFSLHPQKPFWP